MLIDPTYSSSAGFRLSFWMPSPLYAGALFVTLAFVFLAAEYLTTPRGFLRWLRFTTAIFLGVGLGLTGSRTSVIAAAAGTAVMIALSWRAGRVARIRHGCWALALAVSVGAGLGVSGSWARLTTEYLQTDSSALNRVDLWAASLQAFASSSFGGIGADQSATTFLNWYAGLEGGTAVQGFSSTLATVLIEQGWLVGVGLIWFVSVPVIAALFDPSPERAVFAGGCVAVLIGIGATTLTLSPVLIVTQTALVLTAWWRAHRSFASSRRRQWAYAGTAAAIGLALLATRATVLRRPPPGDLFFRFAAGGRVVVANSNHAASSQQVIWFQDYDVSGPVYGQLIRNVLSRIKTPVTIQVVPEGQAIEPGRGRPTDLIVLLGQARLKPGVADVGSACILVHPTRPPEPADDRLKIKVLLLPAVDQVGWNTTWIAWAEARQIPLQIVAASGRNLSHSWNALAEALHTAL